MYNHLKVPESWNSYFSKYPQGLTIMEALLDWVGQVDSMIDHINTTDEHIKHLEQNLEEFYLRFDSKLTEQIQNTLQSWIEDGTLEQVISQLIENRMTYPNIPALQQAPNIFKNGTVVELLGYHSAGDGAGHKRVISPTDDGSGVAVGGKWANVVDKDDFQNKVVKENIQFVIKSDTIVPANIKTAISTSKIDLPKSVYKAEFYNASTDNSLLYVSENGNYILTSKDSTLKKAMPNYVFGEKRNNKNLVVKGTPHAFSDSGTIGSFVASNGDEPGKTQITRFRDLAHAGTYPSLDSCGLFVQNDAAKFASWQKFTAPYDASTSRITVKSDKRCQPGEIVHIWASPKTYRTIIKERTEEHIEVFEIYERGGSETPVTLPSGTYPIIINPIHRVWGLNVNATIGTETDIDEVSVCEMGGIIGNATSSAAVPNNKILDLVNLGSYSFAYGQMIRGANGRFRTGLDISNSDIGLNISGTTTAIKTPGWAIDNNGYQTTFKPKYARPGAGVQSIPNDILLLDSQWNNNTIEIGTGAIGQMKYFVLRGGGTFKITINGVEKKSTTEQGLLTVVYLASDIIHCSVAKGI